MTHPFKSTSIKHYDGTLYEWNCPWCMSGQKRGLFVDQELLDYLITKAKENSDYEATEDEIEEMKKTIGEEMWKSPSECWACNNKIGFTALREGEDV